MSYEDDNQISKKLMPPLDWIMLVACAVFIVLKQYWPALGVLVLLATLVVISEVYEYKEPEVDLDPLWKDINDLKEANAELAKFCEETKSEVTKMNLAHGIKGLGK